MNGRNGRNPRGFTLVEVMVTLVIVGVLSTVALPLSELAVKRSKEQELHNDLREIRTAIDAYKQAWDDGRIARSIGKSGYPDSLQLLVNGVPDITTPEKTMIYFLRRIPRDPFATDQNAPPEATWGKRCYASSADDPQEGDDVYDVYSKSAGTDLRGVPYREW